MASQAHRDALAWILAWFESRTAGATLDATTRFYEEGLLDSFGAVELIAQAEAHFGITFSQADMLSPDFQAIGGLAEIIAAHCQS